jgi:predicted nucleic acid-binding protein
MPPPRALCTTRTVATADQIYADPSALSRLYIPQHGSREMAAWRWRTKGPLGVTPHGKAEIVNAIALSVFRGEMPASDAQDAFAELEGDFEDGHLVYLDVLWRAAFKRATALSKQHSPTLGTRALDVLHVACALEEKLPNFLTFDERQQKLAKAVGLKVISL